MQLNQYPDAYVHWAVMQLTPELLDYVLAPTTLDCMSTAMLR